jgi:hypothetical protein
MAACTLSGARALEVPGEVGTLVPGFQDDFRGTALSAGWQASGTATTIYTVTNGVLRVSSASGDPNHLLWAGATYDSTTQEILARMRITAFGTGDAARAGVGVAVDPGSSQGLNHHFRDYDGEGQTGRHTSFLDDLRLWGPGNALSWTTGTWYWVRLRHEPDAPSQGGVNDLFAKMWPADGVAAEPGSWLTWDYTSALSVRSGLAGITAGSSDGLSEFEVDYVLIKAQGLPAVLVAPDAFPIVESGVVITQQPQSIVVLELNPATFQVGAEGNPSPTYQWYRNDVPIGGATNAGYGLPAAALADDGAVFRVVAHNVANDVAYTVTSSNAVLRVSPDTTPPVLLGAQGLDLTQVQVTFSKPLDPASATNLAHYAVTGGSTAPTVLGARLDLSGSNVLLTLTPLTESGLYTLAAHDVTDLTAARNPIDPGSRATFTATPYSPVSIGSGGALGTLTAVPGGYDINASGAGLGRTSDECFFASIARTGDFDVRTRLAALGPGDVWAQAGLMARDSSSADAAFAAVFATPANVGAGFVARASAGAAASPTGSFPVNYPATWLRLQRQGNQFTGHASLDGERWLRLDSATVPLASTVSLGFAVASHRTGESIAAQFRDSANVVSAARISAPPPVEPPGQATRLTPFVFSEIMYHAPPPGGTNLEFVELFNPFGTPEDLSGYRLTGDIAFTFPSNTVLAAGSYLVVAANPAALQAHAGLTNLLGPWSGNLSHNGGTLRLRHPTGAVFLEVHYDTRPPWPRAADGVGHSLVLARSSFGQDNPRAWTLSDVVGGSPGRADSVGPEPLRDVLINELLAHTDDPLLDYLELYNHSNLPLDISGCRLSDSRSALTSGGTTNVFRVPDGTVLPPRGLVAYDQSALGFALEAAGETVYLVNPARTRVLDSVSFEGQANGVALGRAPDGAPDFAPLADRSPGAPNGAIRPSAIVINEILYAPISGQADDEFVELHNPGAGSIDVSDWRFRSGIDFQMPVGTVIPGGGFLVVARNRTNLLARYAGTLTPANTVGNYTGSLANGGERLVLSQPEPIVSTNAASQVVTNIAWIIVDEVTYGTGGCWGTWSAGGGSSLELIDPRSDRRRASNWSDSDETQKAPWTVAEFSGTLDLGDVAADQLQVLLLGAGECLIDDLEVRNAGGANVIANSTFASSASGWTAEGTLSASGWDANGGFGGGGCYHVRAVDRGDNQVNRIRTQLTTTLTAGSSATLRAKVRWLKGHPEILLRLHGKWLETVVRMDLPSQAGTPGQANSRARADAGPAIFDVAHFPAVPAGGDPVVVTARVQDPDGVGAVNLRYRQDPSSTLTSLSMTDDGTGGDAVAGDGVYSATLPGQTAGTLVAFRIEAVDQYAAPVSTVFPNDAPARECLVRWGDPVKPGSIPAYRIWMTQATFNAWKGRQKLDNTPNDVTFVLGTQRVIYNAQALFAGSPYIAPGFSTPSGNRCGYSLVMPADDPFLGNTDLVLDWPGGHGNEQTAVQEQMAYWLADQMGLPFSLRHYIRLTVNGVTDLQRGGVFEAIIQPAGDFIRAWSPDDPDGDFYKIDRAFEFNDSGSLIADPMPRLQVFATTGGVKKTARYRWSWLKRSYESAVNYTNLFELVDALNAVSPEPYTAQTAARVNLEEFMGIFAFEHIINNFDSWGHTIGKNMYAYKPAGGGWQLYAFDLDWLMLVSPRGPGNYTASTGPLFIADDPTVTRMYNHPPFRRAYLRAVQAAVDGPLLAARCDPVMQAKYQWLVDEGVTLCDGGTLVSPTAVEQWFADRRTYLLQQLAAVASPFALSGPASFATTNNPVTLSGTAPVGVVSLRVNGVTFEPTWSSVTGFSVTVPLWSPRTNFLAVQGLDAHGVPVPGAAAQVTIDYTGPPLPGWNFQVRINEWMADNGAAVLDPVDQQAEDWFELYNTGVAPADLSGFYLTDDLADWTKWQIPAGTVLPPHSYRLVWADNEPEQNSTSRGDLHAAFQLSKGGDTIALFAPDGTRVDAVTFGPQAEDVSEGRYPNGESVVAFLTRPTPNAPNAVPYSAPTAGLQLDPQATRVVGDELVLGWLATSGHVYQVQYTDDLNAPGWLPLGRNLTATAPILSVRALVTDQAQRFFRVADLTAGVGP